MYNSYREIIDFSISQDRLTISLFNSEEFFWLTSAISFAFAAEELKQSAEKLGFNLEGEIEPWQSGELIDIFKESLKNGQVSPADLQKAKEASLHNLKLLAEFSQRFCRLFTIENSIVLGKTFFAHWLIYKIIELEWQQVLDREDIAETHLLLDAFIEDSQELEEFEKDYLAGKPISRDEKIHLRGHWERVNFFWPKIYKDMELLAGGWINFTPPYKTE